MIVGFTGTRNGVATNQLVWLRQQIHLLNATELHHGDCVGADAWAHELAKYLGLRVIVHPPDNSSMRAFCAGDQVLAPKPYLVRNHFIVDACNILLALPDGPERQRSGTWATIRYARKIGRPVKICLPSD